MLFRGLGPEEKKALFARVSVNRFAAGQHDLPAGLARRQHHGGAGRQRPDQRLHDRRPSAGAGADDRRRHLRRDRRARRQGAHDRRDRDHRMQHRDAGAQRYPVVSARPSAVRGRTSSPSCAIGCAGSTITSRTSACRSSSSCWSRRRSSACAGSPNMRHYAAGEALFRIGETGHGLFVVLSGKVDLVRQDELGNSKPFLSFGPGGVIGEMAQLSGRPVMVDGYAQGPVDTLVIPPDRLRALLIAEAELGERIMDALILRRVGMIEKGTGGPVIVGSAESGDVLRLKGFLTRNGHPYEWLNAKTDPKAKVLMERYAIDPAELAGRPVPGRRASAQSERGRARALDRARRTDRSQSPVRRRRRRRRTRRARHHRLRRVRGAFGDHARLPRLRRPGRRVGADRELSRLSDRNHRHGADGAGLRTGPQVRRGDRHSRRGDRPRRCGERGRALHSPARATASTSRPGRSSSRAAPPTAGWRSRTSTSSKLRASTTGLRRSKRTCAPGRSSSWSAAAIPPAKRWSSSPARPPRSGTWCADRASPPPCRAISSNASPGSPMSRC